MKFRPCIDLRNGKVVQIVGATLTDDGDHVTDNFISSKRPKDYAELYKKDQLTGGHVIALGPNNHKAVIETLHSYSNGLQMGGGVTPENAKTYLDAGATHVIVTSFIFDGSRLSYDRLRKMIDVVGKKRLVIDLSCRKKDDAYYVVADRWQTFTELKVDERTLGELSKFCDEFLVHGVDVEGLKAGMEDELIQILGNGSPIPVTYAGGARSLKDLDRIKRIGNDSVDLTIGSALDIFGGDVSYPSVVKWNRLNSNHLENQS